MCVAVFDIAEGLVRGLIGGLGPMGAVDEVMSRFNYEWLSRALVIFFAFLPLFAVGELRRVLGKGVTDIFFQRRSAAEAGSDPPPEGVRKAMTGDQTGAWDRPSPTDLRDRASIQLTAASAANAGGFVQRLRRIGDGRSRNTTVRRMASGASGRRANVSRTVAEPILVAGEHRVEAPHGGIRPSCRHVSVSLSRHVAQAAACVRSPRAPRRAEIPRDIPQSARWRPGMGREQRHFHGIGDLISKAEDRPTRATRVRSGRYFALLIEAPFVDSSSRSKRGLLRTVKAVV